MMITILYCKLDMTILHIKYGYLMQNAINLKSNYSMLSVAGYSTAVKTVEELSGSFVIHINK